MYLLYFQEKVLTKCIVQLMKEIHEGAQKVKGSNHNIPECIMIWIEKYEAVESYLKEFSITVDKSTNVDLSLLHTDFSCKCGCNFGPQNRFLTKMVILV